MLSMFSANSSSVFGLRAGVLLSGGLAMGLVVGACSASLDFTECREDSDCSTFFTDDNRPMRCTNSQCVARSQCTANAQCVGLGDDFICTLNGVCAATTSNECSAPVYPSEATSDDVIFIGSIVDKTGPDMAFGEQAEAAFIQAVNDFHVGAGALPSGKQVALIPCDSGGSVEKAEAAAKHLGSLLVPAILGPLQDDQLIRAAEKGSLGAGVLAYTNSPTATAPIPFADPNRLVWQTDLSVKYLGRAFGHHLAYELDRDGFGTPTPQVTLLFLQGPYGYGMFGALATEQIDGQVPRIPEVVDQVVVSYRDVAKGLEGVETFGEADVLILIGEAEVAALLNHYAAIDRPLPNRIYIGSRSAAAVAALANPELIPRVRLIAPEYSETNLAAVRSRIGMANALPQIGLAYDAAMVTLLAMSAHTSSGPLTGVNISSAMDKLNNPDGTAVSFGDAPRTFIKAAVEALAANQSIDITGASGALNYQSDRTVCGAMVTMGLDETATNWVVVDRFAPECPSDAGTWSPAQ